MDLVSFLVGVVVGIGALFVLAVLDSAVKGK